MKDYYQILGLSENCSKEDIKRAFRKLAFKYHPDTNPGDERQAEQQFKEINEAYGVLGDEGKRQQYDFARKGQFAYGAGTQGFGYSQQDIFANTFSNKAMFEEMSRMFTRSGLRFDQDFLNRVFFAGSGVTFEFFTTGTNGVTRRANNPGAARQYRQPANAYQPNAFERWFSKVAMKAGRFILNKLFGLQYGLTPRQDLDYHLDFEISASEALNGGEKRVTYKRNGQVKNLVVKLPSGAKSGTKIRLKNMGMSSGGKSGDLYLHVKIGE